MKSRVFFGLLILVFLVELVLLVVFSFPSDSNLQDSVAVNEVVQTVQNNWNSLEDYNNLTDLDYVVIDLDGTVLYKTKNGLSESINEAVGHKDTMLNLKSGETIVGTLIVYNNESLILQSEKQKVITVVIASMLLQCGICAAYLLYIRQTVVKPFHKLKGFAERVAGGNLDIPLQMDRHNLFGAFTESFDIMRSELKKARIAEARANTSKKELVAKLSHDIKTPVASIKAASELGMALSVNEKSKENYEQIIQKADQINTLVTNLFSATLEELQELSVTPSDFSSTELKVLLENADYLHRAVILLIPKCLIFADKLRLQQVFDNIFANSYKYANTEVKVTVCKDNDYLAVSVEDFGGGVKSEELPLIKEKFKRGSNTKNIDGAGLGLYISDYCMKEMRGKLKIENGKNGLKVTVFVAMSGTI